MKSIHLASSVLALSLAFGTPSVVFAHVGHGDEFQAEGGINRVKVNPETDSLLGIEVTEIAPAADGTAGVYVPITAIVEDNGKQLVFVHYEEFYEPVPITTGATNGELVEITEGLSIGEHLVTQGSLSLYAESRKTQTAETETAEVPVEPKDETLAGALIDEEAVPSTESGDTTAVTPENHAKADAEGIPHGHDANGNLVVPERAFPLVKAAVGGVIVLVLGALGIRAYNMKRQGKSFLGE